MSSGILRTDLDAIVANWKALNRLSGQAEAGAVVKANGYGLGAVRVGEALASAGARKFFVAQPEEGKRLRQRLGPDPAIYVLSGHMDRDVNVLREADLVPMINSLDQLTRQFEALPGLPFGIQLDTGMNRLGLEWSEWEAVSAVVLEQNPVLVMSHLACADEADHPMNGYQLDMFRKMTDGITAPRSLAATGGILLGPDYHFDVTRPGIGLYGGAPFTEAQAVFTLDLPVIQVRDLDQGEVVGYGNTWQAQRPSRIATVGAGYADGIFRSLGGRLRLWAGSVPCPVVGRVSMDLLTVDVTDLEEVPDALALVGSHQGIDDLAAQAGTIGYEVLTALGLRYRRSFAGG
ncbi:MAG: alanine racemase [Limimaricola sp.]|uniref:alanine racemase n=1 Tax=Limimaricola sp. TaxID=2211665 RepID=UPI001DCF8022|nr:alanine racemase [Limimaricola sp.]MBI1418453.1 alanine racemase [Limimaricola sp.]